MGRLAPWLALLPLALLPAAAAGQAPGPEVHYSRYREFFIPFKADDPRIRQVLLYASDGPGQPWKHVASVTPAEKRFRFQAVRDGWHSFSVRTQDNEGRLWPPANEQAVEGLRVCVDTLPPAVSVRQAPAPEGSVGVEWQVNDENLDPNSIRVEYRLPGRNDWLQLVSPRQASGLYTWNPGTSAPFEVRVLARDLAGNVAERSAPVTPGAAPGKPLPGGDAVPPSPPPAGGPVRWVNSTRVQLNYSIENKGKWGVSAVELWGTRDGRNWQKYDEQANAQPPYVVEVKEEGAYGFTLIAKNGVGRSGDPPPQVGDPPQVWVKVDLTKPVVRVQGAEVGKGADSGNLTVFYDARDENLDDRPITISFAEHREGPWTKVAEKERHTGRYVWKMPQDVPYKVYLRVEAVDKAGNVGAAETEQPVAVDLSQPKVRVLDVTPAGGR
ncbi:MAG TPA: hypothetical protein VFA26_04705 [Gemmataceae bacterium]|nr:hypothetical protein [Gemmataceae bacterium]